MFHAKTQSAENGKPFIRTATPYGNIWVAVFVRPGSGRPQCFASWQGLAITGEARLAANLSDPLNTTISL
jgi:hypothetical protein